MKVFFFLIIFLLLSSFVSVASWAHEHEVFGLGLDDRISQWSFIIVLIASIAIAGLTAVSLMWKRPKEKVKKVLFLSIAGITLLATLFLAISTIYLNAVSSSGGPVHWHADIEIWNCGEELTLRDPEGLSNKIGTSTLHEHNDKRIHLEGVVVKPPDASLGKFFYVIGGHLSSQELRVPTNTGIVAKKTGDTCPNGDSGEVQVFAYRTVNGKYSQQKLADPADFIIAPSSSVPGGDCIIVEFDKSKDKTDKLCRSYKVAEKLGKIKRSTQ